MQGIVEKHGGRIEVESRPGEGCRFRVFLQAAPVSDVHALKLCTSRKLQAGHGRVLLVEDEDGVRAGLAGLLEMIGYEVTAERSGEEAIQIPLEPAPDFLLSDITLPGIDGPDLGSLLSKRWPDLKIVLMSGYIEDASRVQSCGRGWPFLQKPFELDSLASGLQSFQALIL